VVGKVYSISAKASKTYGIDVGQRVIALTQYGGNARYLAVNAGQFVKVPESVDPAEAACLAETYLSAFQVLHFGQTSGSRYKKTSLKGKQLLILGTISSNMGRALSQLSSAASVDNLYATSKEKHYQRLTSLAILPLSLDPIHWFERLKGKIDLIISFDEEVTPLHFKVLRASGEVIRVSVNGSDPTLELDPIRRSPGKLACGRHPWQMKCKINGYNIYNEWDTNLDQCKKDLEHLIHLLDERWVVPEVLDRIPLNKVPRAQELIESKNIPGFIVCEPWIISKSRAVLL
jgi:NADPH:quinone reductase-like Zn-dependent oxidoreductase